VFQIGECLDPSLPFSIVPCSVKNCGNYDYLLPLNYLVNNSVGKALWIAPSNVLLRMSTAMQQRIYREFVEYGQEFFDKPVTETFAAAVIPCSDLDNVVLCLQAVRKPANSLLRS